MKTTTVVHNEKGFVLVTALMILLLLIAASAIVYLVSTKDVRISTRIQGEKSAFAAAEGGLRLLLRCSNNNFGNFAACNAAGLQVTGAPAYLRYTITDHVVAVNAADLALLQNAPKMVKYAGGNEDTVGYTVHKTITGTDTRFNTSVSIDVGVVCLTSSSTELPAQENNCVGG